MKVVFASILIFTSAAAFASETFIPGTDNEIHEKGIVSVHVPWIKDKGKKYDMHLSIRNENPDKGMIIFLSDMSCQRGAVTGSLKHTFFNTGEKTIDFKPNQLKEFTLVSTAEGVRNGEFKLKIGRVYNNPSLDGKTVGKVVAKNLSWSQSDRRNSN